MNGGTQHYRNTCNVHPIAKRLNERCKNMNEKKMKSEEEKKYLLGHTPLATLYKNVTFSLWG